MLTLFALFHLQSALGQVTLPEKKFPIQGSNFYSIRRIFDEETGVVCYIHKSEVQDPQYLQCLKITNGSLIP